MELLLSTCCLLRLVPCLRTCMAAVLLQAQEDVGSADFTKFVAKKSKAVAKKGVGNSQVSAAAAGQYTRNEWCKACSAAAL